MNRISSPLDQIKSRYDVVVIGSGYGGAIAASRLARAGRTVCLLERGREILPGDFPDTPVEAAREMQVSAGGKQLGSPLALFDIHANRQQHVVVGCGLGGTSLINANVSLEPEPEVFQDPRWPQGLRDDLNTRLAEGFERAREMLRPTPYPESRSTPPKLAAHAVSAARMGAEFYRPPINVNFDALPGGKNHVGVPQQACNDCGDCVSGCNYGAKNTTQMNYLPDAWNHGAEIFCEAGVRFIARADAGDEWLVHYQPVDRHRGKFDAPTLFVRAAVVVVAAGTLGSNEIMLRSKEHGLPVSERLGQGFTGNGDILGFGYNGDHEINGIGFGSRSPEDMAPVGPCITSVIDLRQGDDWKQRMVIEEGSIPGALGDLMPKALASAAGLAGANHGQSLLERMADKAKAVESLVRGPRHGAIANTQTYLIMSHDDEQGVIDLCDDRPTIEWPGVGRQSNFEIGNENLARAAQAIGADFVPNPIWSDLFDHSLVTVHPLGGCAMAEDGSGGVVNHKGQVFTSSGQAVHENLYVSDGAVLPNSLAVNPLLTISAITERCCALLAEDRGWAIDYSLPSAPDRTPEVSRLGLRFTETMRGFLSTSATAGETRESYLEAERHGRDSGSKIEFTLTVASHDLDRMLDTAGHEATINGTVSCSAIAPAPMTISEGVFNLFEVFEEEPGTRHMRYRMRLHTQDGRTYNFTGYKVVRDDPEVGEVWPDTSTLYVTLTEGAEPEGALAGKAIMHIEPVDFARQMTTMEVTNATNPKEKLEALARFGKYFSGVLWQTYGGVLHQADRFNPHAPARKKRPLRAPVATIYPFHTEDGVALRLTRYQAGTRGPVMLVHGLGVSSGIFTTDLIDTNLVEFLCAHEFDVWLLDFRASIDLPASQERSNGDQVARYDFPAAIDLIRAQTGANDVQAIVHCYGSTTFFMSMLAGLEGVRSIFCSQVACHPIVGKAAAVRAGLHVPEFLDALGVESLTARSDTTEPLLGRLYDRSLSLYAMQEAQGQCSDPVCHRITFLYASLYEHSKLNNALHTHLHELFAEANIESFEHLSLMCREGVLMDAQGQDVYMPHMERLNLPITFISGSRNACYLPESTDKTFLELKDRFPEQRYERYEIEGYGHIDCMFGRDAAHDVYPLIAAHLKATAGD